MSASVAHAVVLTPPGRGAVATVLVTGQGAIELVGPLVFDRAGRPMALSTDGRIRLGHWAHPDGEEVVVAALDRGRVEIHCHGGLAASRAVIERLVAAGCRSVDWQAQGAIDQPDPIRRSALSALAQARTERAAVTLLDQYAGALHRALADIRSLVASADWPGARREVCQLLGRWPIGSHLTEPWRVVLAGPPNVGKSSLVNALVGYERAIVYNAPGTTRDAVTAMTALAGWPVELCDTAGLGESREPIEQAGMRLAAEAADAADALLLVFSSQEAWQTAWQTLVERWPAAIVVYNKRDLGRPPQDARPPGIATSAITREGLDRLEQAIVGRLVPDEPAAAAAVPFDRQQQALLEQLLAAIDARSAAAARAALESWL